MDFSFIRSYNDKDRFQIYQNKYAEQLEQHHMILNNLDGSWFEVQVSNTIILGNYYAGLNELTLLKELYLNLYIDDHFELENLDDLITCIHKQIDVNFNPLDWSYVTIFANQMSTYHTLMTKFQRIENYHLYSVMIDKRLESPSGNSKKLDTPFSIQKATEASEESILHCIELAYMNGLTQEMLELIDVHALKENIHNHFRPFFNGRRESFVLTVGDTFYGHGSIEIIDSNQNHQYAKLIDIMVLEPYNNQGLAKTLAAEIEDYCFHKGFRCLTGSIENDSNNILTTYKKLSHSMWKPFSMIYAKRLRGERS